MPDAIGDSGRIGDLPCHIGTHDGPYGGANPFVLLMAVVVPGDFDEDVFGGRGWGGGIRIGGAMATAAEPRW